MLNKFVYVNKLNHQVYCEQIQDQNKTLVTVLRQDDTVVKEISCSVDNIKNWVIGGNLIQNELSQLSADEREFLMTGITASEWEELLNES